MKSKKEIVIGSNAFFKKFEDFSSKDKDLLCVMEDIVIPNFLAWEFKDEAGIDVVMIKDMTKEELLSHSINKEDPICVGKILVPEVAEYFNLTIDDLKAAKPVIDLLDDGHKYYKVIYEAYLENDSFSLTDEQLKKAYETYKYFRNE